jgi:hypothetical protein
MGRTLRESTWFLVERLLPNDALRRASQSSANCATSQGYAAPKSLFLEGHCEAANAPLIYPIIKGLTLSQHPFAPLRTAKPPFAEFCELRKTCERVNPYTNKDLTPLSQVFEGGKSIVFSGCVLCSPRRTGGDDGLEEVILHAAPGRDAPRSGEPGRLAQKKGLAVAVDSATPALIVSIRT